MKGPLPFLKYDAAIFHNGAVVFAGDRLLGKCGIEPPTAIVSTIMKAHPDSRISIESNDVMYSNCAPEEAWSGIVYTKTQDFHETEYLVADKILVEAHSLDDMNSFRAYIPDNLYLQLSENQVAMIMNRQATKANGIKMLAAHYGIPMEQIAAFGDDYNDIDMLQSCGTGIAMDNALAEVKAAADHVCGSNEQDGVAGWIEKSLQSFALTEKPQNLIQILHHMSVVTHINLMLRPRHRHQPGTLYPARKLFLRFLIHIFFPLRLKQQHLRGNLTAVNFLQNIF